MQLNQCPEPTPIDHRRSAVAVSVADTARLSFFRCLTHTLLFSMMVLVTLESAADTNTFCACKILEMDFSKGNTITNSQGVAVLCLAPILDAAKAEAVTNGITLGQTVAELGPGWMSPASGVNAIHWSFNNGRELVVLFPDRHSIPNWHQSFVLSSTNSPAECQVWWLTNTLMCFTNQSAQK